MKLIFALALGGLVAGCDQAYAQSSYGYSNASESSLTLIDGHALMTAPNGMTLYTFDKDGPNVSNCYGDCATNWPPYTAAANAASPGNGLTIIDRQDGTRQWAKDGAPLYFWVGDSAKGDTTGDGVGGVWHIAR
ncbi:hypothetical protein N9L47_03480 [Rhodobacteraceae bacterium]|nr:hypothetical protein [Paracoccaceae bacterium]